MDTILASKYWNSNGFAVAIVAVQGGARDWAAYIGGTDRTEHEMDAIEDAMRHGSKLSRTEAVALFPQLNPKTYRP